MRLINVKTFIHAGFFLVFALTLAPARLHAGLFEQLAVSGRAMTMGNAVTAYPPGTMAIHFNPAGLTQIEGSQFDNGIGFVLEQREVKFTQGRDENGNYWAPFGGFFNPLNRPEGEPKDPLAGETGKSTLSGYMVVPIVKLELPLLIVPGMGFATHPRGSRWTFGIGQYGPFGVGLTHDRHDPLSFLGQKAFFVRLILAAPAVAYKVSDSLSVGVSVGLGVSTFSFGTNMRSPNDMVALTGALGENTKSLEIPILSELTLPPPWFGGGLNPYDKVGSLEALGEDDFTTSYNIGMLWEPKEWFAFGAVYQSESEVSMSGDYTFRFSQRFQNMVKWMGSSPLLIVTSAILDLPTAPTAAQKGRFTVNMTWPARMQCGVMIKPIDKVRFTCDLHWTDWEAWKALELDFDQKIQLLRLTAILGYLHPANKMVVDLGMKNTYHFSYGMEIQPVDKLKIRLGYEMRPTSIKDNYFGPVPLPDTTIYSFGIGLDVDKKPKPIPKNAGELLKQIEKPNHIDLNFSYILTKDKYVPSNGSINLNSTNFFIPVYNPYAGLNFVQKFAIYSISLNQVYYW